MIYILYCKVKNKKRRSNEAPPPKKRQPMPKEHGETVGNGRMSLL